MLNKKSNEVKFDTKVYRNIDIDGIQYMGTDSYKNRSANYIFKIFPKNYFKNKTVLDLGCAAGAILFETQKKSMQSGVGVEITSKIDIAYEIKKKHKFKNIYFYRTDIINYFKNHLDEFDCIFLLNVLHHLPNPFIIMDYMVNLSRQYICLEMPDKRWYHPYKRDKKIKKSFKKALNPDDVIQYFDQSNFTLKRVLESENQESYIGGKRKVYLFEKKTVKETKINTINLVKPQLIIGPGASGKSTLLRKIGLLTIDENGKKIDRKYRDKYSVKFERIKFTAKKFLNQVCNKNYDLKHYSKISFTKTSKILQLNPTYRQKKVNSSIRGKIINYEAWVDVARRNHVSVIVCYVPKKILKQRLIDRMKKVYLNAYLTSNEIDAFIDMILDYNIHFKHIDSRVKKYLKDINKKDLFKKIKKSTIQQFSSNYEFSYQKLFNTLEKNNVSFCVVDTHSK